MDKFQISSELWPLIDVINWFSLSFFTDFLQTLHESSYWKDVLRDRRWINFIL